MNGLIPRPSPHFSATCSKMYMWEWPGDKAIPAVTPEISHISIGLSLCVTNPVKIQV